MRICPFTEKECIQSSWADCQFEYAGDEPECVELWLHGGKMGSDCRFLPKGISRTDMLAALGAFGEEEKQRVLEKLRRK